MIGVLARADVSVEYSAGIRAVSRGLGAAVRLAMALLLFGGAAAGQRPVTTFFVLPDGAPGPGSESMLTGLGPAGMPVALDFVDGQEHNEEGYVTVERDASQITLFHLRDLRLTAFDPVRNLRVALAADPAAAGTWSTSASFGGFPATATVTASLPVLLTVTGPGVAAWPTQGLLTLSGTLVPGYFHQVVLLQGSLDVLPQASIALLMKEDLHPPGVNWVMATTPASLATTGAGTVSLGGEVSIQRDPLDLRGYGFGTFALQGAGGAAPAITAAGPGALLLDPVTRSVSGTLELLIDGAPVTRVLDGVGEWFTGPVSRPSGLHVEESLLAGLTQLVLDLRRVELVPVGPAPAIGQRYDLVLRGPPGDLYFIGAAADPVPGISTPVGDVFLDVDALLAFSLDPQNGIFFGLSGVVPPGGEAQPFLLIPAAPQLQGTTIFLAGLVIGTQIVDVRAVTNSHRVTL